MPGVPPRGRAFPHRVLVDGWELHPASGVTGLPWGRELIARVGNALDTFLRGGTCGSGAYAVWFMSGEGNSLRSDMTRNGFQAEGPSQEEFLRDVLIISASRTPVASREGLREALDDAALIRGWSREMMARQITQVMRRVCVAAHVDAEDALWGPVWLAELAVRLLVGETVIFVCPAADWRATITLLQQHDVQAFVVAPAHEAAGLGVAIQDWGPE